MTNPNLIQSRNQTTGLSIMISRCSHDSKYEGPGQHPANTVLILGTQIMTKATKLKNTNRKKWTKEDNKHVLHGYHKRNPKQREYRKRMIQIWAESAMFNVKSQRHADQARIMLWYPTCSR